MELAELIGLDILIELKTLIAFDSMDKIENIY